MSERDCPDEMAVLWEERQERIKRDRLWAHPDCRDPAHPGCSQCREPEDGESEDDDGEAA